MFLKKKEQQYEYFPPIYEFVFIENNFIFCGSLEIPETSLYNPLYLRS